MFVTAIGFIRLNANAISMKCVSMNNEDYKVRSAVQNIISNEPLFYPYNVLVIQW